MAWIERLDLTQFWAPAYKPLLDRYGPAAVWVAGLAVLGYPPTWDDRIRFPKLEAVRSRLVHTYGP